MPAVFAWEYQKQINIYVFYKSGEIVNHRMITTDYINLIRQFPIFQMINFLNIYISITQFSSNEVFQFWDWNKAEDYMLQ